MSLVKPLAVLAAALLATACSSTAPVTQGVRYGPSNGESEINVAASISTTDTDFDGGGSSSLDLYTLTAGFGYHLTDMQEVGAQVIGFGTGGDAEITSVGVLPYFRWNFNTNTRTWFYAGVQAGLQNTEFDAGSGSESSTSLSYGIHGGLKYWLTTQTSFFVEPRFNHTDADDADVDDFTTNFGLSITL